MLASPNSTEMQPAKINLSANIMSSTAKNTTIKHGIKTKLKRIEGTLKFLPMLLLLGCYLNYHHLLHNPALLIVHCLRQAKPVTAAGLANSNYYTTNPSPSPLQTYPSNPSISLTLFPTTLTPFPYNPIPPTPPLNLVHSL